MGIEFYPECYTLQVKIWPSKSQYSHTWKWLKDKAGVGEGGGKGKL